MRISMGTAVKLGVAAALAIVGLQSAGTFSRDPAPSKPKPAAPAPKRAPEPVAPAPVQTNDLAIKRVLKIDAPFEHGDYVWDDAGVPAGPIIVTIDLAAQTLSVFRNGYEIGAAVILYGATAKPSPIGTFFIKEKDADHVSNLYHAPMPYMLRLTNDGVAIHGSKVEWGWATHGCIGVPIAFARLLFGQAKVGDRVIITNGKMLDVSGAAVGG